MSLERTDIPAATKAGEKLSRIRQRQKLVDACITALYQHGPSRTTIDKVVAIADMSPGIVNFYFETKAALLVAALEYLAEEFEDRLLAPISALRGDPVQALRQLIALYLDPSIASPRKVSVWYAFWGEASARSEYYAICGKRDEAFADLVRDLVAQLIRQTDAAHLDADAVALGLIGALEMIWQEIAFHDEADLDRPDARRRCLAYLGSVFPAQFGIGAAVSQAVSRATIGPNGRFKQAACLLVAAELTLAGVRAARTDEFGAGCDIVVQRPDDTLQRISVRVFFGVDADESIEVAGEFDWLAIVMLPREAGGTRSYFLAPRHAVRRTAYQTSGMRYRLRGQTVASDFAVFENNFSLQPGPPSVSNT